MKSSLRATGARPLVDKKNTRCASPHNVLCNGRFALFRKCRLPAIAIRFEHATAVEILPQIHAAPFDHPIIAKLLTEPLRLTTNDPVVARYGETIIEI